MTLLQIVAVAKMARVTQILVIAFPLVLGGLAAGCQVQFVSPYSADVEKRAADMIVEVSAWEIEMRDAAGTAEADPRNPEIRARFARWNGEVEAMAATEAALNPGIIRCDQLAAAVVQSSKVQTPGPTAPTVAASAPQSCEGQVFQNLAETLAEMQQVVQRQCELPWLTNAYFQTIGDRRAGPELQRSPHTAAAGASVPTADQQQAARENCAKIFRPFAAQGAQNPEHGVVIAPVIGQLYDIVYVETKKSAAAAKQ